MSAAMFSREFITAPFTDRRLRNAAGDVTPAFLASRKRLSMSVWSAAGGVCGAMSPCFVNMASLNRRPSTPRETNPAAETKSPLSGIDAPTIGVALMILPFLHST